MNYYIIVFKNTLDAMTAENNLLKEEIEFKMMPTPTVITQSCGLCVRIENKEYVEKIISESIINYKKIYIKTESGYNQIN
ncbi:DUF3343 domain-containing protein [Clostridium septicum]|uniref:DUF3343 domain-containing protein n=1 Tax=Clostridium septicum TaxID=1504 RepID=A0A9N7JLS2_CLOSE|nr:DUF3343 domain-containing protein [Clostridium septicum]AYE34314.1 DUF3343 domain-containing protein [Clostridium septicum]MDU1314270.1 DUF3343 domain-containing protein [Clostridium septicum]QAS59708.1 DUF3343 domain-containing protein [Clostridium septicum]UEC21049.1 DUF3343 domain-containing protein [Clostridium septicum]USS00903.1 DUF3343 domain-containing protein [Clostridium septicum]